MVTLSGAGQGSLSVVMLDLQCGGRSGVRWTLSVGHNNTGDIPSLWGTFWGEGCTSFPDQPVLAPLLLWVSGTGALCTEPSMQRCPRHAG